MHDTGATLPQPLPALALRGFFATGLADWLIDRPALWAIKAQLLPTSQLWAAAIAAEGDRDRFLAAASGYGEPDGLLRWRLAGIERWRRRHAENCARWESAFFGANALAPHAAAKAEADRGWTALGLAIQRLRFADIAARRNVPPVRFAVPSPAEAEAIYGPARAEPWRAFVADGTPPIEMSHPLKTGIGDDYWIRFPSTGARIPGLAWARVHEPAGVRNPPSLVFSNGVCVEPDELTWTGVARVAPGGIAGLSRLGIRVVELELPWHGRRRKAGTYGGEPFLAGPPVAALDLFTTHAQDIAVVTAWCRRMGSARVAIAGASLGGLASLLVASHAARWPAEMRPDGLVVLTAAEDVVALATTSALPDVLGVPAALRAAGWSPDALARWRPFVALADQPPLPPESIVAVLGRRDTVLPFALGAALMSRWRVPADNLFVGEAGHFATQLGAVLDGRAIQRLLAILGLGAR